MDWNPITKDSRSDWWVGHGDYALTVYLDNVPLHPNLLEFLERVIRSEQIQAESEGLKLDQITFQDQDELGYLRFVVWAWPTFAPEELFLWREVGYKGNL